MERIEIQTEGEGFYDLTEHIQNIPIPPTGIMTIFCPHTSCALTINEAYDPHGLFTAEQDV